MTTMTTVESVETKRSNWDWDADIAMMLGWTRVALIASAVDGAAGYAAVGCPPGKDNYTEIRTPRYSTDVQAAHDLILNAGTRCDLWYEQKKWRCRFGVLSATNTGETMPEAVVRAYMTYRLVGD